MTSRTTTITLSVLSVAALVLAACTTTKPSDSAKAPTPGQTKTADKGGKVADNKKKTAPAKKKRVTKKPAPSASVLKVKPSSSKSSSSVAK